MAEIRFIVKDFAIWSHLVAKSVFLIYWMDAFLLQYYVSSEKIGDYSLALRAGNFLWMLPAIFEKNIIVIVARAGSRRARQRYISFLMKVHWLITGITFAAAVIVVPFYLTHVVSISDSRTSTIVSLFVPLAIAMTIRNLAMPFDALILKRKHLFPFAVYGTIPLLIFSAIVLNYVGSKWGTIGMARANIVVYIAYTAMVTTFVLRTKLISPGVFTLKASDWEYGTHAKNTFTGKLSSFLDRARNND
jgi:O-antigen/teichoic acid export membrane protein